MAVDLARSREFCEAMIGWARGKGRVLIVAHDNPDPDSLAAAYALKHLFLVKSGQEATIAFGGVIGRGENQIMVKELEINVVRIGDLDLTKFGMVAMVDTQPGTGNNSFPADRDVHLVIDHHPLRDGTKKCRWVDVREDYGACATILFEYLLSQDAYIGTKLATILFYAIKSETQDLGREWSRADRDAYLYLIPLSNNRILYNITHPPSPREYFFSFDRALKNARTYGNILVSNLYAIDVPDMVAEMADFLLRMEGISVVMTLGHFQTVEILSLRTSDPKINAGLVIQKVVDGMGTAGGHGMIAGGQVRLPAADPDNQREFETTMTRRLLENLGKNPTRGELLLPS
jgi:nanoRNase/pAp phosphatase (c-di-AMP/oligoRNAs hydrolase)